MSRCLNDIIYSHMSLLSYSDQLHWLVIVVLASRFDLAVD
jgi:hypothetical protein